MFNMFSSAGFTQFVNDATHIVHSVNNNILDLILSNDPMCLNIDDIGAPLGTSDHATIHFTIFDVNTSNHSISNNDDSINLTCYDWSAADYDAINHAIQLIDWHSLFGHHFQVDSMWSEFKNLIWPIISLHVPNKSIPHSKKYRPRNYPKNIQKLLTRKAAIWRKLKTSANPAMFSKYQTIANECRLEIFKYDAMKEQKILDANNLGAFYKFVNKKIGHDSGVAPLKSDNSNLITSDIDKANLLNEYFESVFTTDNGSLPHFQSRLKNDNDGIYDVRINPLIVNKILKKLKSNSAAGPDGLPPIFFHHTADSISFPLSTLFRSFVDLHSLPAEWKTSIIIPKFKKGAPSDPRNYRPIALTCTCCKVLETIISNELMQYLSDHKLITPHQHGFLKRHSTTTNLLESINDWTISLSNHQSVTIAYIDFKSAFDCISHSKLLQKLSCYGIKGNLFFWISAFLSNRSQRVKINSSLSSSRQVTSGVCQGSVLGPLLFNVFINDITDLLDPSTTAKLFADDIKLYSSFSNILPNCLQSQLNIIERWSSVWQMRISHSKCNILTIGHHQANNKLQIDNHNIDTVETANDLGVTIDSKLSFHPHITNIVSKANQRKSLILRCFLSRNPANLLRAFKVYVRPLLEYASTTWSPSYVTQIIALESVQRDFTKRIPGCSHLSYAERLSLLKLESLEHRRLIADLVFCFNILKGNNCIQPSDFFSPSLNTNLRGHPLKLTVPLAKTNTRKFFFTNRIVPIWNSLPADLVLSPSVESFKFKLRKTDLNKYLIFHP
jgi:hypothetical protein